jgi:hypothetical protein
MLASMKSLSVAVLALATAAPSLAQQARDIVPQLAPHRAIYELVPRSVGVGSGVVRAGGAIAFEVRLTCEGWELKHTFRLGILRQPQENPDADENAPAPESRERVSRTDYLGWETRDGKRLRFETVTIVDGQQTDKRSGTATLDAPGGKGRVAQEGGRSRTIDLPPGTVFPTWHSAEMIATAKRGEAMFWRHLFDGSDGGKVNGISVAVAESVAPPAGAPPLLARPGWRFKAAYFDARPDATTPNYRVDQVMLDNGVTVSIGIDYGDFAVDGVLKAHQELPRPNCPR